MSDGEVQDRLDEIVEHNWVRYDGGLEVQLDGDFSTAQLKEIIKVIEENQ